ncbi:NUDIX hydrolase [Deinococcus sp. SM5_A1]|uniref:NUDIX hydrolase n=1 Tax=Deinococcus sp. SM5_A1 TaxID=3379094 RepID=UPI00385DD2C5
MTLPHRQCAASLITNQAGEVLLVKQNYGHRRWGAPGGVVDIGETPMQAAVREASEETSLDIEITGVIGIYLLQGGGWPDILAHVFQAEVIKGIPQIVDQGEIAAIEWHPISSFPTPMVTDVEAALEDVQAGRSGVVRVVQRKFVMEPFPSL